MSSKQKAEKEFEYDVKQRDDFVAMGLESYPVRLYRITIHLVKDGKYKTANIYEVGKYSTVSMDKIYLKMFITQTMHGVAKVTEDKIRMTGVDFKVIREA